MTEQRDRMDAGTKNERLRPQERLTLLEELQRLYHQIWSMIWERRFRESERDYGVARDPGILGSLNRQIEEVVKESRRQPPGIPFGVDLPQGDPLPLQADGKSADRLSASPEGPGVLSDYLQSRGRLSAVQPHLGEQMRASTWQHLVSAARLAHQGDEKGAKVHAELAHNAMKEASIYLTEDEYAAFEAEVKTKLDSMLKPE